MDANQGVLDRFLDEIAGGPAILAGNSLGALVVMKQAAEHPAKVAGVVLVAPPVRRRTWNRLDPVIMLWLGYTTPLVGHHIRRMRNLRLGADRHVRAMLRLTCADPARVAAHVLKAHRDLAREHLRIPDADAAFVNALRSGLRLVTNGRQVERLYRDAGVPALVLHGGRDRIVPTAAVAALASRRPGWTFRRLDDLGHALQLEDPHRFVTEVVEWLDGPGTPARDRAGLARPRGADRLAPA